MLSYIVNDIREYVHVPCGKNYALLVRAFPKKRGKPSLRIVMFERINMNDGKPFWIERPIKPWEWDMVNAKKQELMQRALVAMF